MPTIRAAGGFVSQLFELRGKVEQKQLEELIGSIGIKRFSAGDEILKQGTRDDKRLYIVRQGEVRALAHEDNTEYPLGHLKRGDIFGEKACLTQQEQALTISAISDSVLLVIPQPTVHAILEYNPSLKESLEQRITLVERELERQKKLAERRKRPQLLDLRSRPKAGERVIKRFPLVEQAEETDCGAACLTMICRHYNLPMTLGKLREMANVTTEGATMDSLARVGESLGFTTRGLECTYQSLLGFELPFIAHWEGYHYIVVLWCVQKPRLDCRSRHGISQTQRCRV